MPTDFLQPLLGLTLLILPGAWLAFGLPLRQLSFWSRLGLAGAMSPVVVGVEFYLLRSVGLPFQTSVWIIPLLNLGSIWFLVRGWEGSRESPKSVLFSIATFAPLAFCVTFFWWVTSRTRVFGANAWLHMGILYQFPAGALIPEEPELAGIRLAYPWWQHLYWSVLSWELNWSPTRTYALTNLVCLVWVSLLVYETCRTLGASPFASRTGVLWLGLGTNVTGSLAWISAAFLFHRKIAFPVDIRTAPWVRKFVYFGLEPAALALLAGLILTGVCLMTHARRAYAILFGVLLAGGGLVYPQLFPAAMIFCGVLLLWGLIEEWREPAASPQKPFRLLLGLAAVAVLVVLVYFHVMMEGRSASIVTFVGVLSFLRRCASGIFAVAPFLVAILLLRRDLVFRPAPLLLVLSGFASLVLRALFVVGPTLNEYKFMYSAALYLAPVASLALDQSVLRRLPRTALVFITALLVLPGLWTLRANNPKRNDNSLSTVVEGDFAFRLGDGEPDAGWVQAVRTETPLNTIVVTRQSSLYLPAITERSLWAPIHNEHGIPGCCFRGNGFMVRDVRGYSPGPVDAREADLQALFNCADNCDPQALESRLHSLGRPVAVVFAPGEGARFLSWLQLNQRGRMLFKDGRGTIVWLLEP